MLRQADNIVKIEGILAETDLKYNSYVSKMDGKTVDSIGGTIKIRVNQNINGEDVQLEIPVHLFANKLKSNGELSPAYKSIEEVMNNFTSIAATGNEANADRVSITQGRISMNEYYGQNGNLVSFPRIQASFVNKITKERCKPTATFDVEFYVGSSDPELDANGIETGRHKIRGVIPGYNGKIEVVDFIAIAPGVIDAISQYWQIGDTVRAGGRLNFSARTETFTKAVDFGEPVEQTRTVNVSDLIITRGSQDPLTEEAAFDEQEIKAALGVRKANLEAQKNKPKAAPVKATRPTAADLGF